MYHRIHFFLPVLFLLPVLPVRSPYAAAPADRHASAAGHRVPAASTPPTTATLPGIAQPIHEVTITPAREGVLESLLVEDGQFVEAEELLARIDGDIARAAVALARVAAARSAQIRHATEEVRFARQLVDRLQALQQAHEGTDFELLEARTRLAKAQATLDSALEEREEAEKQLALEQAKLEQHNMRAPFAGQVTRISAHPGSTLTRDDAVLQLVCRDRLRVELFLPIAWYRLLKPGNPYPLFAGPPVNRSIQAQLVFVAPNVDAATQTFRTLFQIDNHDLNLPAGFAVQLDPSVLPAATPPMPAP